LWQRRACVTARAKTGRKRGLGRKMAEQNASGAPAANAARFSVLTQFTKDFSFENPNAPRTLAPQSQAPRINLQVNVNARQLSPTDFEVSLLLEGGAGEGADSLFKFELNYAGIFRLENIPNDQIQPLIMIEGPRILFPFARQIVAEAVRGGGYPPLYVDPIDFQALYMQRVAAQANQTPAGHA
jgi:preprotein translocase subunit SecB